jgi:ferredoxin
MAYVIAATCIDQSDQSCVAVCPVDCITSDPGLDRKFYIDPVGCIECGSCETACPNGAIMRDDQLPAAWVAFANVDSIWYEDPGAARDLVDRLAEAA